jgi:aspartate-semialdehyde dehydrogenase
MNGPGLGESRRNLQMKQLKVAIVGATGAVGRELLKILDERKFPVGELTLFASARSEGKIVKYRDQNCRLKAMTKGCFNGIDIAFFDASDAVSQEWVPEAAGAGAWVVDNSATYRMDEDVLLLVPEVNGHLLENRLKEIKNPSSQGSKDYKKRVFAGPNCSTVQMVLPLKVLNDRWGLERVVVSTYQSTSGAGTAAMDELSKQTVSMFNQIAVEPQAFAHQIAFNCIPHIGGFKDDDYTSEEQKMMAEAKKILGCPQLRITATAVRVPTFSCHAETVNVECRKAFEISEVRNALKEQPGIILQDEPAQKIYPMGMPGASSRVEGATGRDAVYVGRIRKDPSVEHGLNLWIVSDNLRKGAALNAVQIGEILVQHLG